jgi:hypothetical protein
MLMPLAIGITIVVVNVIVQSLAVWAVVGYLARLLARRPDSHDAIRAVATLSAVVLLMFAGHLVQIGIWALVFRALGEFDGIVEAFYHSTVNFTSLGYGDIVMSERWRLLGGLEAGTGVMMFGVSTALFFSVITKSLERRLQRARKPVGDTRSSGPGRHDGSGAERR